MDIYLLTVNATLYCYDYSSANWENSFIVVTFSTHLLPSHYFNIDFLNKIISIVVRGNLPDVYGKDLEL